MDESNTRRTRFKKLLKKLAEDPKVRAALQTSQLKNENSRKVQNFKDLFRQVIGIGARVLGRKRARLIADWVDLVSVLVDLSLILKENVFDRPEVRSFFGQNWGRLKRQSIGVYGAGRGFVSKTLSKTRRRSAISPLKNTDPQNES